jgi:hypothetical protein
MRAVLRRRLGEPQRLLAAVGGHAGDHAEPVRRGGQRGPYHLAPLVVAEQLILAE